MPQCMRLDVWPLVKFPDECFEFDPLTPPPLTKYRLFRCCWGGCPRFLSHRVLAFQILHKRVTGQFIAVTQHIRGNTPSALYLKSLDPKNVKPANRTSKMVMVSDP